MRDREHGVDPRHRGRARQWRVHRGEVSFLLSDEASFITGGYDLVDGGYTAV